MTADSENVILAAITKIPGSMMEAARIAGIPYKIFVRHVIQLGVFRQNKVVLASAQQHMQCMLQAAGIIGVPFMPCKQHACNSMHGLTGNGIKFKPLSPDLASLEEVLEGNVPQYPTNKLKRRLLECGIKENTCEACGIGATWLSKPLVLALDHIDGDRTNHRLVNIRMLCPNCHSQTETYCGRNADQHHRRHVTDEEFIEALRRATTISEALRILDLVYSESWYKRARKLIGQHQIEHLMGEPTTDLKCVPGQAIDEEDDRLKRERYILAQQPYVRQVQASGINFRNPGWENEVAILIGQKVEVVHTWMQTVMPDFYAHRCFKHKIDK